MHLPPLYYRNICISSVPEYSNWKQCIKKNKHINIKIVVKLPFKNRSNIKIYKIIIKIFNYFFIILFLEKVNMRDIMEFYIIKIFSHINF